MTRYRLRFEDMMDRNTVYRVLDNTMHICNIEGWDEIEIFCCKSTMDKIEKWLKPNFKYLLLKFETKRGKYNG